MCIRDSDYYKDVRNEFTTSEWIDVLLGAIDYNAGGYESEEQKLSMLTRIPVSYTHLDVYKR